ncbi:hypothetical protein, partial [Paenibacillus polymyxa]|uniref:hypothetical protein n=1 Tax=Paenibacillus polymyxa TaxID=1406 RepID=UPI001ED94686
EDSGASILLTQRDQLDRLRPHGADRELIAIEDLLWRGWSLQEKNARRTQNLLTARAIWCT